MQISKTTIMNKEFGLRRNAQASRTHELRTKRGPSHGNVTSKLTLPVCWQTILNPNWSIMGSKPTLRIFFNLCITASAEKKRDECIAVTLVNKACKICNSKYQYEKYLHVGGLLLNPNWSVVGSKPSLRDFDLLSLTVLYVKVNSFVTWHISSYSILKEIGDNLVSVIPPDVAGQSHWNNVPFYYGNDLICWRGRFGEDIYI